MDAFQCWPLHIHKNLTLISLNTINKHNKIQKSNSINAELTLFLLTYNSFFLKVLKTTLKCSK
jgi:hypothetical protein